MNVTHACFLFWGMFSVNAVQLPDTYRANQQSSDYLVKIDGRDSDREEFLYVLKKSRQGQDAPINRVEFEENLDLFIDYKLKVAHALNLGLDTLSEFQTEFRSFKEELVKPYLVANDLQEGEIRKVYDRMHEIVKASHILLQFPPNASAEDSIAVIRMAEKIKAEAESGADFARLALQHSEDPSVKSNEGNLGYFTALQMVLPFEEAAFSLSVGEISEPVLSDFGCHIIRLDARRPNPGQVQVSHLLIRNAGDHPDSESLSRRKIAELYQKVQENPEVWPELIRTYSEDAGSKSNKGLVPWFGVGSLVPEFEQAAFGLEEKGDFSPPVKTTYGYHLLRLEGRRGVPPFEEMMPTIKSRILRNSHSNMISSQVIARQKSLLRVRENEALLQKISDAFSEHQGKTLRELVRSLNAAPWKQAWLLESDGKQATTQTYSRFLESHFSTEASVDTGSFDNWYRAFLENQLATWEEAQVYATNADYRHLLEEYRNGMLLFELMNEEVWEKALKDSTGQREYFRQNQENYLWEERIPALILTADAGTDLSAVKSWLSMQTYRDGLEEEVKNRFLLEDPLKFSHEQGLFEPSRKSVLRNLSPKQSFHAITENGRTVLLVTGEKIPAQPKTFDETRGRLIQDYQQFLEKKLLASLKETYTIQINEDEKEELYQSLAQ
ncbi:peptidylprolyl isomerase [Cyclobacterium xiamenense]|uniref:peptidylprolyl isomerase n=1 Tax=Cyclobacterium xiamenense TaxID=1297121 RepID=UPI0035D08837